MATASPAATKTLDGYKKMFRCDEARIIRFETKMFLVLGWSRSTRDDGAAQWHNQDGEPIHFKYFAEEVVASGATERELLASAKEYKRISKMSAEEYLEEVLG